MPNDDKTGYGNPPKHTRFKPGQSGNPKGRPKGTKNLKTDLEEELRELITIREGGNQKIVSKQRAMLKSLTAIAVHSDSRAAAIIFGLIYRLFHEDGVRIYRHQELEFGCRCSRERAARILSSLPRAEVEDLVEDGRVTVSCQFCNTTEAFDESQISALFET